MNPMNTKFNKHKLSYKINLIHISSKISDLQEKKKKKSISIKLLLLQSVIRTFSDEVLENSI